MNRLLLPLLLCFSLESIAQPISWITDCSEKSFCFNQGSCTQGAVFIVEKAVTNCGSPNVNYSYKIDVNNDGGLEIQSSEDTVTGNFGVGTHKIIWRASDNCGNVVQCTYLFHIKDCTPPSLICINGLTQTIDPPFCEATFNVESFILNLSDNCTPTNQIQKGMRRAGTGTGFPDEQTLTFGMCENGLNILEVWVKDANGLTNQCSNYVLVQSSGPACDCNADSDLQFAGCARSANNSRLANYRVQTTLKSTAGVQPPVNKVKSFANTDSCFTLLFEEIPFGGDYQAVISADRPDAALNGVTTFDLVLISKHILGIEALTSAYQLEAADVNNSNSVTTFDIVETRKLILGINDTFTNVPAWRFVRPLPDPSDLASYTALQDTYQVILPNLQADLSFPGYNFIGIKYGDINFSASLSGEPDDRTDARPLLLEADDQWLHAGEEATIEFRLGDTNWLDGWQVALNADAAVLELLSLSGLPTEYYQLTSHELRAIDYDGDGLFRQGLNDVIFVLKIRALQPTRLSEALHLNTDKLKPEAYVPGKGQKTERRPIQFQFKSAQKNQHFSQSPNPFTTHANFTIRLKQASLTILDIFSIDGRRVYSDKVDLGEGSQTIRVASAALPPGNIFFYRLWVNGEVFSGKMTRMD